MSAKSELRRLAEARRQTLVLPDFAARIAACAGALNLPLGAVVAGYAPFRSEADPGALMAALARLGHPLALPVIVAKEAPLAFRRWQLKQRTLNSPQAEGGHGANVKSKVALGIIESKASLDLKCDTEPNPTSGSHFSFDALGDPLSTNAYGIGEPLAAAEAVTPPVLLVPLLAFDAEGYRLGYGGGYYDRTLAALRAQGCVLAIGIAYAGQEVETVPCDEHDQRLDAVLTETGLREFRS